MNRAVATAFGSVSVAAAVLVLKLLAWGLTGSVALLADALESVVNVVAALAALAAAGVGLFIGRAFGAGQWGAGLFGLAVAAGGTWQVAPFILRNRPRVFTPDALPADLLP